MVNHRRKNSNQLPSIYFTFMICIGLQHHTIAQTLDLSIIPADRRTEWNPGIEGGIPNHTTVYATINAADFGYGTVDASEAIQNAIDACPNGQVVKLSDGIFRVEQTITITKSVVLRGDGPTKTLLRPTNINDSGLPLIIIGQLWTHPDDDRSVNLLTDAVKGAKSVTVASTSGLTPGQLVLIDQVTDDNLVKWNWKSSATGEDSESRGWCSRYDRSICQVMEVASVSGTTITFNTPFHIKFQTGKQAQITPFDKTVTKNAGIEDLHIYGGQGGNVHFENAEYCWAKNIDSEYSIGGSVTFLYALKCVLRDSYLHETKNPTPGGAGYGIMVDSGSADNLIENNISWNFNKVMVMRASGGGNVIGYNYMDDGWIAYAPGWMESGLNASHMTTPHYELFEGNQSFNMNGDWTWGGSIYITFFRNYVTTLRHSAGGLQLTDNDGDGRSGVSLGEGHWWYNFIGNVIGSPSMPAVPYIYQDSPPWFESGIPVWILGVQDSQDGWYDAGQDQKVLTTILRDGNYDYFTKQTKWDRTVQPLPNSLYLTSKPAFFGSLEWPWVDGANGGTFKKLPAKERFESMMTH